MNIARIETNETCNHQCSFCDARQENDRAELAGSSSIRRRIDGAHARDARQILLTGGEPTLRPDLPAIVRYAARGGADVVLETNATLIGADGAHELAGAGLVRAVVHVPAWNEIADYIAHLPGAASAMKAGLRALVDAGVQVDLAVPIVTRNEEHAASVPAGAIAEDIPVGHVEIVPIIAAPDHVQLLPLPRLAQAIVRVARAAKHVGVAARLSAHRFVPPCVFPDPGEAAHLYAMTPGGANRGGYERQPGCAGCSVEDRCPGLSASLVARQPAFQVAPLANDRVRRRLSIISSVAEQIERELVTREVCRRDDGTSVISHTVRVNFHCNQACGFCFVSTHLPPAEDNAVIEAIEEVGALGGVLVLSGGEPTLNARLPEYVRRGREAGAMEVVLQTNATRLADMDLTQQLIEAGLTSAFVSLHGTNAETSDGITDAPGTFEQTCRGLDALTATPLQVTVNFVFCEANMTEFPDYVDMVVARWPSAAVCISFVASSTDMVPRTRALVPRYADIMPYLADGLRRARAAKLRVSGFESMCGIPLCLLPDEVTSYASLDEISAGMDSDEFLKPAPCTSCDAQAQCFGIRRGYAELHGVDELQPIRR